jgi:hypothetical protein
MIAISWIFMSLGKIHISGVRLHCQRLMQIRCLDHYQNSSPNSDRNLGISHSCHHYRVSLDFAFLIQNNFTHPFRYLTQYRKLGVEQASVSGQEFYPVYILANQSLLSYYLSTSVIYTNTGLLAVTAGCFSAFIWTLFPGAERDRSQLRKGLGTSLYILANYYSCIKAVFRLKLKDTESAQTFRTSNQRLTHVRRHLYIRQIAISERLNENKSYQNWEPNLGGKFPRKTYDDISDTIQK